MSRARIEAILVAVLAGCGGSVDGVPSSNDKDGRDTASSSSGDATGASSSSSSSSTSSSSTSSSGGATLDCNPEDLKTTQVHDLAVACDAAQARYERLDAGTDAGFDCESAACAELCAAAGQGAFTAGSPAECKRTATKLECTYRRPCGRRFAGLLEPSTNDALADAAYLEAASVIAFEHLARDLAFHEAPFHLLEAALRAAEDERRHTAMVHALAGGPWPEPNATEWHPRALLDIAIENAVEGCVGETWGALVALAQAKNARSADVRSAFAAIAADEIDHAALAYDLHAWIAPLLSADERDAVRAAKDAAWARFEIDIDPSVAGALGIPNGDTSRRMLAALASTV